VFGDSKKSDTLISIDVHGFRFVDITVQFLINSILSNQEISVDNEP
jgi:hypothetical protein